LTLFYFTGISPDGINQPENFMTLDQLLILTRVADTGSVLAAAESVNRTQPTVSVALKNLEAELNLPLLDRSAYRAKLTPAGEQLCHKARSIMDEVEDFKKLAHYLAVGHEAKLRLAIEAACPLSLIMDVLKTSEGKYPQTDFSLEIENSRMALDKLLTGKVDMAIVPWPHEEPRLETVSLAKSRVVVVATPGFCPIGERLTVTTMKTYVQIIVRDSGFRRNDQSHVIIEDGRNWQVSDHSIKKELIVAGMGWGRIEEHQVQEELADGRLVLLEIENYPSIIEIDIRAARRFGEPLGPVASALWDDLISLSQQGKN
jgi:DNA-binding transcriptional LysR family regulator